MEKAWKELIARRWAASPSEMHWGDPADDVAFAALERLLGLPMPAEFVELYSCFNGVGFLFDSGRQVDWLITPILQIPRLQSDLAKWFEGTHPNLGRRILPLVDSGCGDVEGFAFEDGQLVAGFFNFEHEAYEFEEGQDWREFIVKKGDSMWGAWEADAREQGVGPTIGSE